MRCPPELSSRKKPWTVPPAAAAIAIEKKNAVKSSGKEEEAYAVRSRAIE
jgi:hypothetical protein